MWTRVEGDINSTIVLNHLIIEHSRPFLDTSLFCKLCNFILKSPTDLFRRICYHLTPWVSVVCYVIVCQPAASYS